MINLEKTTELNKGFNSNKTNELNRDIEQEIKQMNQECEEQNQDLETSKEEIEYLNERYAKDKQDVEEDYKIEKPKYIEYADYVPDYEDEPEDIYGERSN